MANGSNNNTFNGRLPNGAGSGTAWANTAGLSDAGKRAEAFSKQQTASTSLDQAPSMRLYYSADVLAADLRGRMPAQIGGSDNQLDPVGYCKACGLHPLTEQDAANIRAFPDLATDALARSGKARMQAQASTGRHAAVTVHASLENTPPSKRLPDGTLVFPKASLMTAV